MHRARDSRRGLTEGQRRTPHYLRLFKSRTGCTIGGVIELEGGCHLYEVFLPFADVYREITPEDVQRYIMKGLLPPV